MDVFTVTSCTMAWCRQERHRLAGPSGIADPSIARCSSALRSWNRHRVDRKKWQIRCSDDPPDWDKEMSLFRQRTMQPNQLETLRKKEAETDVGRVLFCNQGLAIVQGLDNDAPVGTMLSFVSGAQGVLLWRRSDNICFILLLGEGTDVVVGEAVECKIKAILQVVDADRGPSTKREFLSFEVPAGEDLFGQVVDFLGRPQGSNKQLGTDNTVPLFNTSPSMEMRQQIHEPLLTGVKAIDALTPLGRGQAQLVTGLAGAGKTTMMLDSILGQLNSDVKCVYAAIGQRPGDLQAALRLFERKGAMPYTCIISAPEGSPLGEQYAALATACSVAERVRDSGAAALVILDDVSCMVRMWERITVALAELGMESAGLDQANTPQQDEDQLVEYEGMLVSAAAAQRRRFFASLIQRAAKMNKSLGAGSMTLLMVAPGMPATGQSAPSLDPAQYQTLAPELRDKLLTALAGKAQQPQDPAAEAPAACVRTEVIEEFMSITDGQIVVHKQDDVVLVDPELSISRIGVRAYPPAMKSLAPQIRFELVQAADSLRFSANAEDPIAQKKATYAAQVSAALAQAPGRPVPLEEQVATLYAIQKGFLLDIEPSKVALRLDLYVRYLRSKQAAVLTEIAVSQELTPENEEVLQAAMKATLAQFDSC
eukprot:jgi/Botrbrau1/21440/Bobra.0216s0048.1